MQISRRQFTVAALAASTLLGGGLAMAQDKEPIKIGVVTSQTGPYAGMGVQVMRAVEFAVEKANAEGGIDGRQVEFSTGDDEGNPDAGRRAGEKLALEGYKFLIGGPSSATSLALSTQLERWDAIYINVISKADSITGEACNDRTFRVNFSDAMDMSMMTPWLKERPEKSWGIFGADYVWGHGSAAGFKAAAESLGHDIKIELYAPLGTKDYSPYISQLKNANLDGLWVAISGADATIFARQAQQFELSNENLLMVGTGAALSTSVQAAGKDLLGFWNSSPYHPGIDNPQNKEFVEAWKAKYNELPTDYEGTTYMGLEAYFKAIEKSGSVEPIEVANALSGMEYQTLYGDVTMRAEDGQLQMDHLMARVEEVDGTPQLVLKNVIPIADVQLPPSADCQR